MKILICSLFLAQISFAQMSIETVSEVGVTIEASPNSTFVIKKVQPASPAFNAGLKENDLITSVKRDSNSEPIQIAEKSLEEVVNLLKGPKGSLLALELLRHPAKDLKKVTLVRSDTLKK
tara:strand:- start:411 stop:770 length:360 start_codon:yes stop_codon:yes gene_type:complete